MGQEGLHTGANIDTLLAEDIFDCWVLRMAVGGMGLNVIWIAAFVVTLVALITTQEMELNVVLPPPYSSRKCTIAGLTDWLAIIVSVHFKERKSVKQTQPLPLPIVIHHCQTLVFLS